MTRRIRWALLLFVAVLLSGCGILQPAGSRGSSRRGGYPPMGPMEQQAMICEGLVKVAEDSMKTALKALGGPGSTATVKNAELFANLRKAGSFRVTVGTNGMATLVPASGKPSSATSTARVEIESRLYPLSQARQWGEAASQKCVSMALSIAVRQQIGEMYDDVTFDPDGERRSSKRFIAATKRAAALMGLATGDVGAVIKGAALIFPKDSPIRHGLSAAGAIAQGDFASALHEATEMVPKDSSVGKALAIADMAVGIVAGKKS